MVAYQITKASTNDPDYEIPNLYTYHFRMVLPDGSPCFYGYTDTDQSTTPLTDYGESFGCDVIEYEDTITGAWVAPV